jgi:tRNA (mo5U34)-methyltransferase
MKEFSPQEEGSAHSAFLQRIPQSEVAARLRAINEERAKWLGWKPFAEIRSMWHQIPDLNGALGLEQGSITIGEPGVLSSEDSQAIYLAAKSLCPWKKGPFRLWDTDIDAEWRSDFKWDRLSDSLPNLAGADVLDVGCHNGYYMYRMLENQPASVLGIDPVPRLWYQFNLIQRLCKPNNLEFQLWGWQEMAGWEELFDGIFCMGILYHHSDPVGLLRTLHQALRPGGFLVLESIVIPGDSTTCLFPGDRYAKMRNVWFIPTVAAMEHMLYRTRFKNVELVFNVPHTPEEQRTTAWNPAPSHADFMMPGNPQETLEGYPAPRRAMVIAQKA